jgi:Fe-S cluster biogenesis protein NfuA
MFIQTALTPNDNAIKFLPGVVISPECPVHFSDIKDASSKSSLAVKLFSINNVEAVFFGADFITITKSEQSDWQILKPEILMVIMDHLVAGFPVFDSITHNNLGSESTFVAETEIEKQIIEIIENNVRPSVAMDGGDIIYKGFVDGVVRLELRGACSGCPSSTITLKHGIESMLKHFIPEVQSVEAV